DVFANAAARHAEKMFPLRGFPMRAEAAFIVVSEHRSAIGPRNLPPEDGGDLLIEQRGHERAKPVRSLRCGVGVQENSEVRGSEFHSLVYHPRRVVILVQ